MTKLDEIRLPVNNELGDQIVKAWLKLHVEWAKETYDKAIHEEDKGHAASDIIAFNRVLNYIGGEHD